MKKQLFNISLLIFVTVFGVISLQAQTTADSLRSAADQSTGVERAELMLELSEKIWRSDPAAGIQHSDEVIEIALRVDDPDLQAKGLQQRALIFYVQGDHSQALEDYLEALEVTRSWGNKSGEARALHNLGNLYLEQGNFGKSLDYYFQSLRIKEELGDKVSQAATLNSVGIAYERRGELKNAIEFYGQAVSLSEEVSDLKQISITANHAGSALKESGRLEESILMLQKALNAANQLGSSHAKATILLNLSSVYQSQKSYQEAISLNKGEVENARQSGSLFLEAEGLENLGDINNEMGNTEEAIRNLEAARTIFDSLNFGHGSIQTRNKLTRIYLNDGKYGLAVTTGLEALERAEKGGAPDDKTAILQILIDAYIAQDEYKNAIHIQDKLLAVKDSAYSMEQQRQISKMQTLYETEQKEQEIALLKEERERERLLRNAFAAGLVLIFIIGFLIYNRQKLKINKNRTELENIRLKEQQLEQDLEFKNKELATHSLHMVQKNETMKELKEQIKQIKQEENGSVHQDLNRLENMVNYSFSLDKDWEQFRFYFEEVHSDFFDTLKEHYPELTPSELRLSALVKLNLTIKEIATIMGISPDSVKTARYRLRKKLDLRTEENLTEFLMEVEKKATG